MSWKKRAYDRNWKILKKQIEEYEILEPDIERDPSIFEFDDVFKYFEFYVYEYGFACTNEKNVLAKFKDLCVFMDWNNLYSKNMNIFTSKNEENKLLWLKLIISNENLNINVDLNSFSNFYYYKKIAESLNWNNLYNVKKSELDDFIAIKLRFDLNNLKKLQEIIKFYDLQIEFNHEIVPKSKRQCRKLIKKYLYVNIYDYVGESNKKFDDFEELRNYTFKKKYFYPLKKAKSDYKLKTMLRHML